MPKPLLKRLASITLTATMAVSSAHLAFADLDDNKVSTSAAYAKHVFVIVLENKELQ